MHLILVYEPVWIKKNIYVSLLFLRPHRSHICTILQIGLGISLIWPKSEASLKYKKNYEWSVTICKDLHYCDDFSKKSIRHLKTMTDKIGF